MGRLSAWRCRCCTGLWRIEKASPPEHAYRVEKAVKGPTTTVVFDDGMHVCNNLHHVVRPLIADWLSKQLKA